MPLPLVCNLYNPLVDSICTWVLYLHVAGRVVNRGYWRGLYYGLPYSLQLVFPCRITRNIYTQTFVIIGVSYAQVLNSTSERKYVIAFQAEVFQGIVYFSH